MPLSPRTSSRPSSRRRSRPCARFPSRRSDSTPTSPRSAAGPRCPGGSPTPWLRSSPASARAATPRSRAMPSNLTGRGCVPATSASAPARSRRPPPASRPRGAGRSRRRMPRSGSSTGRRFPPTGAPETGTGPRGREVRSHPPGGDLCAGRTRPPRLDGAHDGDTGEDRRLPGDRGLHAVGRREAGSPRTSSRRSTSPGCTRCTGSAAFRPLAAMAYGTATIPAVDKIFGPGNAYVCEAKRQVFGAVGVDLLPGPSEVMVIADESARPDYAAADLLAQAEHGSGRERIYLVATSAKVIAAWLRRWRRSWLRSRDPSRSEAGPGRRLPRGRGLGPRRGGAGGQPRRPGAPGASRARGRRPRARQGRHDRRRDHGRQRDADGAGGLRGGPEPCPSDRGRGPILERPARRGLPAAHERRALRRAERAPGGARPSPRSRPWSGWTAHGRSVSIRVSRAGRR